MAQMNTGPIPKPEGQSRRRGATAPTIQLPAEGRKGPAPEWPLESDPTAIQREVWTQVWQTPQAVIWDRLGWYRDVAKYVHYSTYGTLDADKEARQWSDRIGLNPLAMLRLRWTIAADEVSERRAADSTVIESKRSGAAARERLRLVDPGAVAGA